MEELDILCSPSYWSKRIRSPERIIQYHIQFIENASVNTPKRISCELDIAYGSSERQKIDIFGIDLEEEKNKTKTIMTEPDILCSPKYWSKRIQSPERIIQYHIQFIKNASINTPKRISCELDIPYGNSERQKIDIFGIDLEVDAPIFIFIHGGYWQTAEITRSSYHFMAEQFHQHKIKSIFVGYDLCPEVTISQIVDQIKKAMGKCFEYIKKSRTRAVYLMGHSAGAHLVSFLFTNFIKSLPEKDQRIIKGVFLVSGVFDLEIVQKTVINKQLKLDKETAREMSPLNQQICDGAGTVFHFYVGEDESPEFLRQSKKFSQKLNSLNLRTEFAVVESVDHFNIIEQLAEENCEFVHRIVGIIAKE